MSFKPFLYTAFAAFLITLVPQGAYSAASTKKEEQTTDENGNNLFSAFRKQDEEDKKEEGPAAVNQYSNKYRKKFGDWSTRAALLPQEHFELHFVNSNVSDDAVVLRMDTPALVSGCTNLKQPTYQATQQGETLWVKVQSAAIELKKDPRYGNSDCKTTSQSSSIDIPLSRAMIESAPIRKIAFRSTNHTDYYRVDMHGEKLSLLPQSSVAFKPRAMPDGSDALSHWFFPENTVVLFLPGAKADADLTRQVQDLASSQGLMPLKSMMPDFQPAEPNTFYFVDPSGTYARNLNDKSVFFGRVMAEKNSLQSELDVYARTPYLPG